MNRTRFWKQTIQETHDAFSKAAISLKKIFRGAAGAPLGPTPDHDERDDVERDNRPVDDMEAEKVHL
jgi:hypothetical protein